MGISERPDRREAFLLVAKDIASSILEGGQDEIAGARLIAREVYDYANVPEALLQMAGWLSEWDDAGDNCDLEYQAVCREEIRKAAKQMSGNLSMLD